MFHFLRESSPAPFADIVLSRYRIDIVGANRQRDFRELGTAYDQST